MRTLLGGADRRTVGGPGPGAPATADASGLHLDRREALAWLTAGMTAALAGCGKPHEEIVPYVQQPLGVVPGEAQHYATSVPLGGYARGALGVTLDGRPIKLEGLAAHPYSLGATDPFLQAEILSLYDPGRQEGIIGPDGPSAWEELETRLFAEMGRARGRGGSGVLLLTDRVTSPTEIAQIAALRKTLPQLVWRRYEAVNEDAAAAGARLAFGRPLDLARDLSKARRVVCLDADPLGPGPEQVRNGRGFIESRNPEAGEFSRWYVAEGAFSLTGANADHRIALHPDHVHNLGLYLAAEFGGPSFTGSLPPDAVTFAQACARDLKGAGAGCLVLVGRNQPPELHALAHWLNGRLKAPVTAFSPVDPNPQDHSGALAQTRADLEAGRVQALIILGGNPAYDAPASLGFAKAVRRAPFSLHLSLFPNETSAACRWRAPLSHPLESWGDLRAPDGSVSLVQPLIRPLGDSRTRSEILAVMAGALEPSAYALVRATHAPAAGTGGSARDGAAQDSGAAAGVAGASGASAPTGRGGAAPPARTVVSTGGSAAAPRPLPDDPQILKTPSGLASQDLRTAEAAAAARRTAGTVVYGSVTDPEEADQATAALEGAIPDLGWKKLLASGVKAGSAAAAAPPPPAGAPRGLSPRPAPPAGVFALLMAPDPLVYDGRYAENAWLQECPKPLSLEVWGASLALSPQDARTLGLKDQDHVRLSAGSASLTVPVRIQPGHAEGVVSCYIGGGRRSAGPVGSQVGTDLAPLRSLDAPWRTEVRIEKVSGSGGPPNFQRMPKIEGEARKLSPVVDVQDLPALRRTPLEDPSKERPPTLLLPENPADDPRHQPAWAMVIDQAACIGCNACVISCQAENNIPVVGPAEIARGRDMHWLRIDAYDVGVGAETRPAFQPVPCMQCEHAPCEPVCPVEASIHDHEGLNDQVYNRCIGTRFCESNCPYKVRRFNFFDYSKSQAYAHLGSPSFEAARNPDVTVRTRGVMEKCTYCVQRISGARRTAEKEERPLRPGEVVTACQAACPTQAIRFGDQSDRASGLEALKHGPRHFALLAETGARPRTTYLARLRNPNPELSPPEQPEASA